MITQTVFVEDNGKVKLGGSSPTFAPVLRAPKPMTADSGKVRIGGSSPAL